MIGIVGGMGSRASVAFQSRLLDAANVQLDAHYPMLAVVSRPDIPSRTKYLAGEGPSPVPAVVEAIAALARAGARFCALPCNTLHLLIDEVRAHAALPVIDMVEAVERQIAAACGAGQVLRVLGTGPTIRGGGGRPPLYDAIFQRRGVRVEYLSDADERTLRGVIDDVKSGLAQGSATARLAALVAANLPTPDHRVLLACTELDAIDLPAPDVSRVFSAGRALAAACIAADRAPPILSPRAIAPTP